jgi:hypothetical protein
MKNKGQNKEDNMLLLIRKVDTNFKTGLIYSILNFQLGFPFGLLMLVYALFIIYIRVSEIGTIIALTISFSALIFTFFAYIDKNKDKALEERNYNLIVRNYSGQKFLGKLSIWIRLFYGVKTHEEPLLRAVIKLKAKNHHLNLENLYSNHPELFDEKALLDNLLYK